MFCNRCGTENVKEAGFCTGCGADFSKQTPFEEKPTDDPSDLFDSLDESPTIFQSEIELDTFKVGTLFAGRYEILGEGEKGGMGVVYKVKDTKLNNLSALKIIHPRLIDSSEAITRFRQEVSISRDLHNPYIVRVYDLQEWEGKEYFTMEWLDGVTLREILDRRKMQNRQFSLVEADNIISQLSEALHYAHAYTVHRDIKPENVLVESGRGDIHSDLSKAKIKLTDFGIAKMLGPSRFTMTSMQMGTPYYMAPEQKTDAGKVDKRADIYAAGVVLFELLTFQNSIGPEMPSEINPNLPQEIDDVYKKAVATNPEKRYSGIKDLSDDINKIVAVEKQRLEEEREKAEEAKRREIEKQKQAEERRRMEGEEKERQEVEKQRQEQGRIRREAEEHKQREKKEKERQEKVEVERKEKEACVVRIGGRKRKKRKMYERKYASPNLAIIIPAGVCAVIGIAVAIMFGMGGDSKSTYRENPPSGTSTYTKPTETGHKENVSTYSKPVETRQGNYNYVEMVLVRGGSFNMGDTFGDKYKDEKPMHNVTVGDFYIGRYEVTQGEWEDVMGNNLSRFKNGHNYPVERVRWDDVQVFIGELNQRTGKKYRLPTEAEWEYAAKSGGKREEWSGTSSESLLGQYAWYDANSGDKTHPVGQKMPNGLGIYDMTGNVWEWCQDIYSEKAYSKHQRSNPIYTGNGSYRVIRGGSWGSGPGGLRAARRNSRPRDSRNHLLGFRLARTP